MNKNEFIDKAKQIHGDKYDYSKVKYKNTGKKVIIHCPIHGDFEKTPMNHLLGQGCPSCSKENKTMPIEEFIQKARKIHGDKYDYSKVEYVNSKTKVCIVCPIHGEFWQTPSVHNRGCGCPLCSNKGSGKQNSLTKEEFIKKAKEKHGDKYDYSKVEYKNNHTKVCIICPEHGEFWQIPQNHIKGQGCPKCSHRSYAYTIEEFKQKAREIHGDKYNYSKINYINNKTKVCIICPIHGDFLQTPHEHLKGNGCPKCSKKHKLNTNIFITKSNEIHNNKYDYSKVKYVNTDTKVCIICPEHGEFWQTPHSHLNGNGCPKCYGNLIKTNDEFITESNIVHHNFYNYSKINYINNKTKVCIICPIHGEFWQSPQNHIKGQGCPKCANENNISENKIYEYIKDNINRRIVKQKKFKWLNGKSLDIYIPSMNIAVEYQGRQHFVPVSIYGGEKHFLKQKQRDIDKYNECKEHNIKLFYFSKEKEIPNEYLDIIYTEEEELLKAINSYNNQI